MKRIVWISEASKEFSDDELLEILSSSRINNRKRHITGLLLYDQKSFLQIMEGGEDEVDFTFKHRIETSRRHRNVIPLVQTPLEERIFENWAMGFFSANHAALEHIPGYKDFRKTYSSFLELRKDDDLLNKIVRGFQEGRWHLGKTEPSPKSDLV
ncbi:MAG: BLUF domain-containing protein [Verrucomicrobiae bacterium]|nr:BLUF domain-containing protein [Verrucomicrobiae bacterium]